MLVGQNIVGVSATADVAKPGKLGSLLEGASLGLRRCVQAEWPGLPGYTQAWGIRGASQPPLR